MARKRVAFGPRWTTDPQYLAFEADLTAHPDDDTPRLVLADWLEDQADEHASARAEFIRVQIELSRCGFDPALAERERLLLAANEAAWLGSLAGVVTQVEWKRGFPQRLKLGVRSFLDNADEIFRQAPILHLQLLRISQTKMTMGELAACPHFAKVRGLSLPESSVGDDKLAVILSQADLRNLEILDLRSADVGRATLSAIESADLPRLKSLNLSWNQISSHVRSLFRDDIGYSLSHLDLGNTGLGEPALVALFRWAKLDSVESLSLAYNRLGNAGARLLAGCPFLGRLRSLHLNGCEIGMRGMIALAESPALANVASLDLSLNSILPTGLEALVRSAFVSNLRELNLNGNRLGDAGGIGLAAWPGLSRLTTLDLRSNEMTPAAAEALFSSPHLGWLVSVSLAGNAIGSAGARALANCPKLVGTRRLDLNMCDLSDAGAEELIASPHLSSAVELKMGYNALSAAMARRVVKRFPAATFTP